MIVGLDHVQLAMPPGEEAAARHFYGEVLGLTEVPKPQPLQARGGCWFVGSGTHIHLGVQQDFVPARKAHPALLVDDVQQFYARLDSAGVPVTWDTSLPDVHRFYATDPFGNRLELLQDGDGLSQSSPP